jgi:threonine aldolase
LTKKESKQIIDLRSDTVTLPNEKMRKAMYDAEVGDDVLREDPTVNRLEALSAEVLEKEAALFVPSGTFGNQLALFTHTERGNEVILSEESHIVEHEAGAASVLASVQLRPVMPENSFITWEEIEPRVRKADDIHYPKTGCIAVENGLSNGDVQPITGMMENYIGAQEWGIPVHMDGARIFNAAIALKNEPAALAAYADSVMFCLSKGLAAPAGSVLAGSAGFIEKARRIRKIMGGGMRQAGVLAAPGIIALTDMRARLAEDHANAEALANIFASYDILDVDRERVKMNMVFLRVKGEENRGERFVQLLSEDGILTYPPENGKLRFVTHYGVTDDHIRYIETFLPSIIEKL